MNVFVKKVLIEKYSISSMTRWIVKQKVISVKYGRFEKSAQWRDLENHINKKFYFPINQNEAHTKSVKRYFELFEDIS
jgi:hypothetical protein